MNPTLTVLLYSSIAAAAASLGALPLRVRGVMPTAWIGWANALAAGLMLGTAYVIVVAGLNRMVLAGASGAFLGIGFIYWTHLIARTEDLDLNRLDQTGPEYGYQVLLVQSLHSASEGVAIGAAMSLNIALGVFAALAFAVHNIPEATVLCTVLRARRIRLRDAAGLAVLTNVSLVLLSIVTFSLIMAAPSLLPWALGFAMGALVYLVMMEPLPESYRQAGNTSIALVTSVAMGMVVLLKAFLL
ncbi:MAG: ZIP family metal transporter [Gemmatimonadota bacterium]|nr:MAG: ZIP family metal transporter [Gemmatimonadota bacterium]